MLQYDAILDLNNAVRKRHIALGLGSTELKAGDLPTDVTNFNGPLDSGDTTVQLALESLDDNVLPLTAGDTRKLTGDLYINKATPALVLENSATEKLRISADVNYAYITAVNSLFVRSEDGVIKFQKGGSGTENTFFRLYHGTTATVVGIQKTDFSMQFVIDSGSATNYFSFNRKVDLLENKLLNINNIVTGSMVKFTDADGLVAASNVADVSYLPYSIGTAKGDLISFSASATPLILVKGTDGYFLKANSVTATGLEWVAGGGGVTDHGALTGLGDDDHTQYLLLTAGSSRELSGDLYFDKTTPTIYFQESATTVGTIGSSDGNNLLINIGDYAATNLRFKGGALAFYTGTYGSGTIWLGITGGSGNTAFSVTRADTNMTFTCVGTGHLVFNDYLDMTEHKIMNINSIVDNSVVKFTDADGLVACTNLTDVAYEPALTKGNLTASSPLAFDNTRQVIGGAAALSIQVANTSQSGYLTNTDWNTFSGKIDKSLGTAKGDIIAYTASATPSALAVGGTNGWVLKVNSATATGLEWAASGIITDHGGLGGLGDDDHTIYLLADGTRKATGDLIVNKATPAFILQTTASEKAKFYSDGTNTFLDATGNITIDADGGYVYLNDNAVQFGYFQNVSSTLAIKQVSLIRSDSNSGYMYLEGGATTATSSYIQLFGSTHANAGLINVNVYNGAHIYFTDYTPSTYRQFLQLYRDSSGNAVFDADADLYFDADGGDVIFQDGGTEFLRIVNTDTTHTTITPTRADTYIVLTPTGSGLVNMSTNVDMLEHKLLNINSIATGSMLKFTDADGIVAASNVTDVAYITQAIGTTKGDLISFTASATPVRLAVGVTNGMLLRVNSATSTGLEWATVSGGGLNNVVEDLTPELGGDLDALEKKILNINNIVTGSILAFTDANGIVAASNVTDVAYVAQSIGTTKGDIISFTASSTPSRLAVGGTNGWVLKVNSATATGLEWGASTGGLSNVVEDTTPELGGNLDCLELKILNINSIATGSILAFTDANGIVAATNVSDVSYLPLTASSSAKLTGDLYINKTAPMLAFEVSAVEKGRIYGDATNFYVDAVADLYLDADGGNVLILDGGTEFLKVINTSSTVTTITTTRANTSINITPTGSGEINLGGTLDLQENKILNINSIVTGSILAFTDANGIVAASNVSDVAYITQALGTAKGDLISFSASATPLILPVGGTNGWVLKVNSATSTGLEWGASTGGLANIVEDTTPELGGNLDCLELKILNINSIATGSILAFTDANGIVAATNVADVAYLPLTASSSAKLTGDLYINKTTPMLAFEVSAVEKGRIYGDATNFYVDAVADLYLDADGADVIILDGGTEFLRFTNTSSTVTTIIASRASTSITIDATDDINLDADGADIVLLDAASEFARFTNTSSTVTTLTVSRATTDFKIDTTGDIYLDADGADIILLDAASEFGRFVNTSTTVTTFSITRATTDLAIDVTGDITLDADGGDIIFLDNAVELGRINTSYSALTNLSMNFSALPSADNTCIGPKTNYFQAGTSVTAMQLVILNSSAQWVLTDANAVATYSGVIGISLETKTVGNAMSTALAGAFVRDDAWTWTVGGLIYISETAGAMTQTQPTTTDAAIRVVGVAISATSIYLFPSLDYITHT